MNMENENKDILQSASGATGTTEVATETIMEREWRPQDADKFEYKQNVRNRVRNSQAHPNAIFKKAKEPPRIDSRGAKNVAVYARVSTKSTNQTSSIENQQKYYKKRIDDNPDWTLQKIYSDEGISGTSVKKRKGFLQMIEDAEAKEMDLILCASISRFSRNLKECLEYIEKLKTATPSHPVGIYFETENIYTLDPASDQQLEIYAMLADWESATKSRRMILSYDQRIITGQYPVSDLLGYKHTIDGELIIQEEEAKTVKFIFYAYVLGYSYGEIAEILTEKQRPTRTGRTQWNAQMVRNITLNERRWGDLDVRKTIVISYKLGKTKKNEGERDSAYVPGYHEGIVSPDIAKALRLVAVSNNQSSGVSDLGVITEGRFKGYVSIALGWNGVNNETFHRICRSVYDDDELHTIEREARILAGEEHSNILSMTFTGYEIPLGVYYLNQKMPSMTITPRTIRFNKAAHKRFENCDYVEILYHPILKSIIIRESSKDNPNAVKWTNENGEPIGSFTSRSFTEAIYENLDWRPELSFRFRCVTKERDGARIMIVSLDEPQVLVDKKAKEKLNIVDDGSPVQYVQHKAHVAEDDKSFSAEVKRWHSQRFGMSLALKKRRDDAFAKITSSDMRQSMQIVDNPLIGSIPTREEIAEELDQLLMCM